VLIVHTVAELRAAVAAWRKAGEHIGFVPTMGNLHRGHLQLVRSAREKSQRVVVSVFVNPLQFAAGEDFDRYPRTLAQDQEGLRQVNCDLLFAPSVREVYPKGLEGLSRISVPGIADILCGQHRPGHFDGVATVVNILFNLVQPDAAWFGEKDWQQLQIVRRMVSDLRLPIVIVGVPTERDTDGLALSSRNQHLSPSERTLAPVLYQTLLRAAKRLQAAERDYIKIQSDAVRELQRTGFVPQYVEVRTPELDPPTPETREWIVICAAYLGSTRLIDNVKIKLA